MIRVAAMYPNAPGSRFDMDYYLTKHIPGAKIELSAAGLTSLEVDKGVCGMGPGARAPYHAITYMTFPTMAEFEKALELAAPGLMADMPNYTDVQLQIQVSEVA